MLFTFLYMYYLIYSYLDTLWVEETNGKKIEDQYVEILNKNDTFIAK